MTEIMNTLVIGNGFDIEHGLPTKYTDFINYMNMTKFVFLNQHDTLAHPSNDTIKDYVIHNNKLDDRIKHDVLNRVDNGKIYEIFPDAIHSLFSSEDKNLWLEYFDYKIHENKMHGDNWIDFEEEISNVVKEIEILNLSIRQHQVYSFLRELNGNFYLSDFIKMDKTIYEFIDIDKFIRRLEMDLDKLINCLDYYIQYIDKLQVKYISKDIEEIKFNRVISFNYSDTYRKIYDKSILDDNIDFIHGKAGVGKDRKPSKLILGTEETLADEDKNVNISCIRFKKYFQRIYKRTGLKYKHFYKKTKIYKEFGPKECKKIAYIFGHSLAVTDKDALKFIIDNNDEIVVFYHDEEQHAQQIANLVIILKKDTLIDAAESVIEFRKQKERIYCKK